MYLYRVSWNSPGCLPETDPSYFESEGEARTFLRQEFEQLAINAHGTNEGDEWDEFIEAMEFHGDAAMGRGDSYWDGPDGYVYSIECEDVEEEEARAILAGNDGMFQGWSGGYNTDYSGAFPVE